VFFGIPRQALSLLGNSNSSVTTKSQDIYLLIMLL
jgi:hypothetical protein